MFKKIILKSMSVRKKKFLIVIMAVLLGTAILTSLTNIYIDLSSNIGKDLRSFGANIIMLPQSGSPIALDGTEKNIGKSKLVDLDNMKLDNAKTSDTIYGYSPYLYGTSKLKMVDVVVAGVDFTKIVKINPWWRITGTIPNNNSTNEVIIGLNVAQRLNIKLGDTVSFPSPVEKKVDVVTSATKKGTYSDSMYKFTVNGIIKSNSTNDDQVFIGLNAAQKVFHTGNVASLVQVSALTNKKAISSIISELKKDNPNLEIKSVSRISKAENIIQNKVQWLMLLVVLVALISTILCVMSTMMTSILERSKEIGIMKAIGATRKKISNIFYGESIFIGVVGGFLGGIIGLILSEIISLNVFDTPVILRFSLIIFSILSGVLITVVSCYSPIKKALSIDPIVTLRGDE